MTINEARLLAGLTKKEMARLLDIPYGTVRSWCEDRHLPPGFVEEATIKSLIEYTEKQYHIKIIRNEDKISL